MGTTTEDYFEPCCQWKRGNYYDEIGIELNGIKTEDMKVTLKKVDKAKFIISIMAESPRRVRKMIEIPNDDEYYDPDKIKALLSSGNLVLTIPKKDDPNKLEISMPKLEVKKFVQESAEDMKNKFSSAAEYAYSKRKIAALGLMLMASGFFAYKYYTECFRVFEK